MINAFPFLLGPLESPAQGNGQTGGVGLEQSKTPGNPSDNPFAKILLDQSVALSLLKSLKLNVPSTSLGGNGSSEVGEAEKIQEQPELSIGDGSQAGQLSHAVFSPQFFLAGGADRVETKTTLNNPGLPLLTGYFPIKTPSPVENSLADNSITQRIMTSDLQQSFRDAVKDNSHLVGSSEGEATIESAVEPGKHVGKPLDRLSSLVQDADRHILRIPSPPVEVSQGPLRPVVNQAFQASLPFEETPASLANVVQSTQSRMKYVNGDSSLWIGGALHGKEPSLAIQAELLRDSGLSSSDHRSKDVFESTGKIVGVDPNGGQGINNGMGSSTHSQAGFQQSLSSLSTGSGVRMAEERVPDLPTPALQRLQMDVQLSEANRIQIDVGVQHRQVYAGLLMDQATLKNLAIQFVPQLEDQLAQSDLDLQEFSAEVRDQHHKPESETRSHGSGMQHVHRENTIVQHAPQSVPNLVKDIEALGLHLVA
jgi:hypothetical protein